MPRDQNHSPPGPLLNDQRHAYVLDAHLDDSHPWHIEKPLCLDCGWMMVVVWRDDTRLVCPMCSPEGRARVTVQEIIPQFEA